MSNYENTIKAMRHCSQSGVVKCEECEYYGKEWPIGCMEDMMRDAATEIEELLAFAHYVADKVTRSDEDWEDYHEAFTEVACRKLVKLGIVTVEDDKYVYSEEAKHE